MTSLLIGFSLFFLAMVALYLTIRFLRELPEEADIGPRRLKTRLLKFRKRLLR